MSSIDEAPQRSARWVGALVVIVLLALAVPGANAVPAAWRLAPARHGQLPVEVLLDSLAVVSMLAAAGFLVALARSVARRRRPTDDEEPEPQRQSAIAEGWARTVAVLTVLAAVAVPFFVLTVVARLSARAPAPPTPTAPPTVLGSPASPTGESTHVTAWPGDLIAVAVVGLAALLLLAILSLAARRRPLPRPTVGPRTVPAPPETALAEAVSAGATELGGTDDPRAAVLRCYAAMTHTLRRAGVAGRVSDVPGELLARAAVTGTVPAAPARELTDLFGAARFSSHPVTEAQRQAAGAALTQIRTALDGRS